MATPAIVWMTMMMVSLVAAQSATPSNSCLPAIASLSPCLGFIAGNSSSASGTAPPAACCAQLSSVVRTQSRCLCAVLGPAAAQLGINLNQSQAISLPGACNVTAPPVSQCNAIAGAPAGSPTSPPAESPTAAQLTPSSSPTPSSSEPSNQTPTGAPTTSPKVPAGGSKSVPTTGAGVAVTANAWFFLMVATVLVSFSGI